MISIRQSFLEQFRRTQETEYGDEQELIAHIRGEDISNWQMRAGTAWHYVLAHPVITEVWDTLDGTPDKTHRSEKYTFGGADVGQGIAHVGPGLVEVPGSGVFTLYSVQSIVELTGQADLIAGLMVSDHKTKFSVPDSRDYESSLQWRVYLLIHECTCFRYNFFHFKDPDESGYCELKDISSVRYWRYPGMEADVLGWLGRFVDWAGDLHLLQYLDSERRAA